MIGNTAGISLPFYSYRREKGSHTVILLPVGTTDAETRLMARFCRRISRTAPLLLLKSAGLRGGDGLSSGLATVVADAVRRLGLAMIPIVVVGHGDGADLGCSLLMSRGTLFAAAVLLRPSASTALLIERPTDLSGIHVLLAQTARDDAVDSPDWDLSELLGRAGAELVVERVLPKQAPGSRDAALARIFVGALFGR